MKKIVAIVLILFVFVGVASADSWTPVSVEVYDIPSGHWCVTDYRDDGPHTECYCACENSCPECEDCPEPVRCEECEDCESCPKCPECKEKKQACNRGLGNGSEDCDPGNSGGKPGAAGEDNE